MSIAITKIIKEASFNKNVTWITIGIAIAVITAIAIASAKWLYLGAILAPIFIYLSIEKPFIFPFGAYVFLIPFDSLLSVTGNATGATLTKFLGVLTILVLLLKGSFEKRLKPPNTAAIWWVLFIMFGILSITWAIQPNLVESRIPTAAGLLILYLVSAAYKFTREEYDSLKRFILAGGLVASFIIIYNFIIGQFYYDTLRISLTFSERETDPNAMAFDMLIPVSLCMAMLLGKKDKLIKICIVIGFSIIMFGILLTGSRGCLLGVVIILLVYLMFIKKKITYGIVFICIGAALIMFLPDYFVERMGQSLQDRGAGRLDIWVVAWKMLEKYWLVGAGLNNFPMAYTEFASYAPIFHGLGRGAHNIFLCSVIELGIIGFGLMFFGMVNHYRQVQAGYVRDQFERVMLRAAFWGIVVSSFFLDTIWNKTTWLLWMLIMMHGNVRKVRE